MVPWEAIVRSRVEWRNATVRRHVSKRAQRRRWRRSRWLDEQGGLSWDSRGYSRSVDRETRMWWVGSAESGAMFDRLLCSNELLTIFLKPPENQHRAEPRPWNHQHPIYYCRIYIPHRTYLPPLSPYLNHLHTL